MAQLQDRVYSFGLNSIRLVFGFSAAVMLKADDSPRVLRVLAGVELSGRLGGDPGDDVRPDLRVLLPCPSCRRLC